MLLFDSLSSNELDIVSKHMNVVTIDQDEVIFREGDKGDYVCFVVEGSVEVLKQTGESKSVVLNRLRKNSTIGEMALIDEYSRSATVRVVTQSTLVTLSRTSFDRIIEDHPRIGIKILKGISRLLSLNLRKTSSRLADYMLPLA
jgi:CRP-like cAMP-binding protein